MIHVCSVSSPDSEQIHQDLTMFHLCLLMIILGTITVQGARQDSMHVRAKRESCEPNHGACVHVLFPCFGHVCPQYSCAPGSYCCCPGIPN
ncbi:small cysteine-rich protein 8-like isoform X1 [Oculina patagonica]